MDKCFKMDFEWSYGSSWKKIVGMIKSLFKWKCSSVSNNKILQSMNSQGGVQMVWENQNHFLVRHPWRMRFHKGENPKDSFSIIEMILMPSLWMVCGNPKQLSWVKNLKIKEIVLIGKSQMVVGELVKKPRV